MAVCLSRMGFLFPQFSSDSVLTAASGSVMQGERPSSSLLPGSFRMRAEGWQLRILELADLVPEVAGAAGLVRNSLNRVRFVVEGPDSDASRDFQAKLNAMDRGRAGVNLFLAGEFRLTWPEAGVPEVLSVEEFKPGEGSASPRVLLGGEERALSEPYVRVWNASARRRLEASSPHKATMDLVEAMYLHQLADSAVASSRLASAGVMVWPTEAADVPLRDDGSPEPGSRQDLRDQFHKSAVQSLRDFRNHGNHIPFIIFVDPNLENYMPEMFRIERDDHAQMYKLRFETYRLRYASAIDLPIESVTGMGDTNHWSAWAIREDQYRSYLAPMIEVMRRAIESRFVLNPDFGLGSKYRLGVDASDLIAKPDQSANMLRLLQLENIDPAYAFEMMNLDPEKAKDAPIRGYRSSQMDGIPSDMTLGGERGGGQFRS